MVLETGISERRACRLVGVHRWTYRYRGIRRDEGALRERLKELAHRWPRFGYRRLAVLLRREGYAVNHKKIFRLYTAEDLKVRRKRKKIRSRVRTAPLAVPGRPNERWSMDFMQDCLANGRRFRILTIVDDFTRELSFLFHQARHPLGRVHPGAGDPPRPPPASKSSRSPRSCGRRSGAGDRFSPNSPYASGRPSPHSSGRIQVRTPYPLRLSPSRLPASF